MNFANRMNLITNNIIKGIVYCKIIFILLYTISFIVIGFEIYGSRNQIEGRELVGGLPDKLLSLFVMLFVMVSTLFFDLKVLEFKIQILYNYWIIFTFILILVFLLCLLIKTQWIGVTLMLLEGIVSTLILYKFRNLKVIDSFIRV